jgi:hypothetical protein
VNDFERSWARFLTYHEVNGLQPTIERWRRWVEREGRAGHNDRSIPSEAVASMVVLGGLIVACAVGAGVAYVFDRALCGGVP